MYRQGIVRRLWKEWNYLRGAFKRWQQDDGALMAAAVAYYVGLSLFPLLLVLISGVGLFLQFSQLGQSAEDQVLATLSEHLSPSLKNHVEQVLSQVKDRSSVSGPIGFIGITLAALAGFMQFERAFDRIWNIPPPISKGILVSLRRILIERGIAFLILLSMGLLVVIVFIAGMALSAVQATTKQLLPVPDTLLKLPQVGFTLGINTLMFTLLYRNLPKVLVTWRSALRGGMVAAVGWEIGRQALAVYLVGTRYDSSYGVVGSFIAVQLWCYYAVAVLFLGAEYIQEFCRDCHPLKKHPRSANSEMGSLAPVKTVEQ